MFGSHYSGREPPTKDPPIESPRFEYHGPESVVYRAGDIYLHHLLASRHHQHIGAHTLPAAAAVRAGMDARAVRNFRNDIEEKVWVGASPQLRQVLGGAHVKARVKARVKAKTQAARASNANENLRRLEIDLM